MGRRKLYQSNAERQKAYRERIKEKSRLNGLYSPILEFLNKLADRQDVDIGFSYEVGFIPNKGNVNNAEIEIRRKYPLNPIILKYNLDNTSLDVIKNQVEHVIKELKLKGEI